MTSLLPNTWNYYYGARYYDPRVSVWLSVDPKSDWYPSHSPYNFSLNNPINLHDPNGLWVEGAGIFRNVFNSDEKILAQDLAAEHGGEAFKHGDAWRATWTTQNNEEVEGVDVNMDDLHIVDFKKGVSREGTYDSGAHMADAKFNSWLDDNMRSGESTWNSIAEPLDQEVAPMIAKEAGELNNTFNPVMGVTNGVSAAVAGQDLWGNKKEGVYERGIRPAISILSFGGGLVNVNRALTETVEGVDLGISSYETIDRWINPEKGSM